MSSTVPKRIHCCTCVGSYSNFIKNPVECLKNIISNPIVISLRRKEIIIPLLNLAAEMDPTIKIFGTGENAAVTGSTCYQVLSDERLK